MAKNTELTDDITTEEVVLDDNQLICVLTDQIKPAKPKEVILQSLIQMLNEEYGFDMADMEREYNLSFVDSESGNNKKMKADLVVFEAGKPHDNDCVVRICFVNDEKPRIKTRRKGLKPHSKKLCLAWITANLAYGPTVKYSILCKRRSTNLVTSTASTSPTSQDRDKP